MKENVIVGRLIPAGTGYSYHQERARKRNEALAPEEATVSQDEAAQALTDALNADGLGDAD